MENLLLVLISQVQFYSNSESESSQESYIMDLTFCVCFSLVVVISSVSGNHQIQGSDQELFDLDRGRSAWNFGGFFNNVKRSKNWARPTNVPGTVIANRRQGSAKLRKAPVKKATLPPGNPEKRNNFNVNNSPPAYRSQTYTILPPMVSRRAQTHLPWNYRQPQPKLQSRSDTISDRFNKDDLWHLDKGESYVLKKEDLERDHLLRDPLYETNELDFGYESEHSHDTDNHQHVKKQLEKDAEKMVSQMEQDRPSQHVHHHHHYEPLKDSKKQAPTKKPDPMALTPATLPRIHNPIPLGCLLAVPAFHPIRPRHHLTCLLSLPGTPNLNKRRRKRSTNTDLLQLFSNNKGMTPVVTRKHYGDQIPHGNAGSPQSLNVKVPATIVAPPKFDKSDVFQMLMGSQGLSIKDMGTVLATNSRYVRFGRGYKGSPNNGEIGGRQGRHLQWPANNNHNNIPAPQAQQTTSASNAYHVVAKPPPPQPIYKSPTQPPKKVDAGPGNAPAPPVILNVKITPVYNSPPISPAANKTPAVSHSASGIENFKDFDWKPITKNISKPQKPVTFESNDNPEDLKNAGDLINDESKVYISKVKPAEGKTRSKNVKPKVVKTPKKKNKENPEEAKVTAGLQNWIDNVYQLKKSKHAKNVKPFTFATKKNTSTKNDAKGAYLSEENEDDDEVVGESSSFTEMIGGSLFDELNENDYLYDYDADDDAGVSEEEKLESIPGRYFKVKKLLLDQLPDPIMITVPKDGDNL